MCHEKAELIKYIINILNEVAMKKITSLLTLTAFILVLCVSLTNAQDSKSRTIGKIFTKDEADQLFGKVISSVELKKSDLKKALAKSKNHVHFKIKNKKALVMDERKQSLTDEMVSLASDEVTNVFSKSVVNEFLKKSKAETLIVEERAGVLSISDGTFVLEFAGVCPPICPF